MEDQSVTFNPYKTNLKVLNRKLNTIEEQAHTAIPFGTIIDLIIKHMENKKAPSFVLTIVAIILGVTLFKQFDFEKLTFQKPALAIVYIIVLAISMYFLIKPFKKK